MLNRELEAYQSLTDREIWRHQAEITDLKPGERIPYQVTSFQENTAIRSDLYTLTPTPKKGTNLNSAHFRSSINADDCR